MRRGVPTKAQEVTDSEGRRRFHGAFTGGFSAGYFNSVGSKEGWQPTAFSSSRRERAPAARFQQRAEDFMDEEDDPLLGRRLETTERYDTLQADAKRALRQEKDAGDSERRAPIPGFALPEEWVLPANNSIGVSLLRRMGWKEGHGIGQRVRKRKTDAGEPVRTDAKGVVSGSDPIGSADSAYLPPRNSIDVKAAFPEPKVDRYGAGFDPFASAPEFARYKQRQQSQKSEGAQRDHRQVVAFADAMKPTTGSYRAVTGYGLGALEENDDLDVYGGTSMSEFDTEIGPLRLGASEPAKLLANEAEVEEAKTRRRRRAVCSDGRKPLPGFELARAVEKPPKRVVERLQVPREFKPFHTFCQEEDEDGRAVATLYQQHNFSTMKHGRSTTVTARERAALLGASVAEPTPKHAPPNPSGSVFDLMPSQDKQKLMEAVSRAKSAATAAAAASTAAEGPSNRAPTGLTERQPLVRGSSSDQLRATISASIAKRFVSSAVEGGDASTAPPTTNNADTAVPSPEVAPPKRSYRSQSPWVPNALLCKRFHVKCVGITCRGGAASDGDRKPDLFAQELVPQLVEFATGRGASGASAAAVAPREPDAPSSGKEADEKELPPLPEVERPTPSLLKSIFEPSDASASEEPSEDDDDDDESESESEGESEEPAKAQVSQQSEERESASQATRSRRGRRGAADYFSSDSSSAEEEEEKADDVISRNQLSVPSAKQTAAPDRRVAMLADSGDSGSGCGSGSDHDSASGAESKRKKRKKRRQREDHVSDDEHERKSRKKRSKRDKRHKKEKKDKKDKKDKKRHHEASSKRTRSRSPSASRMRRKHRHRQDA